MQVAPAVEPGDAPSSLQLLDRGGGHWKASHGNVVFPAASRSLRQGKNGRIGGFSVGATVLAAVVAVTAVYLVLRCAVYLVNASKRRVALRFLAKAEETTRKEAGEPCTVQDDDQPEAAAGAAGVEREGEVLVKDELLERARQYVAELANLLSGNEWVFLQLDRDMRARLVAEFLCLSLVEVSALLSLLERDERAGIEETIPSISTAIGPVYISLDGSGLTQSRRRHLKFLLSLLGSLPNVEPAASTLSMTQRLLKLKQLLELQDMALTQLKYGISALTKAVESSTEAGDDPTAAASAAKGAAAATAGATATPDLPEAPAECLLDAVVRAIELTVHRRKKQFFVDPILSAWMREVHHQKPHYGLMSTRRLSWLTQRPLKTHSELLEALRATPLGSGNVSLQQTFTEEVDAQQEAATSSAQQELSQSDRVLPQQEPNLPRHSLGWSKHPPQHSQRRAGAEGSTPFSASPSISTATAGVPAAQSKQSPLQIPGYGNSVLRHGAASLPRHVSSPAAPGRLQVYAMSAAPGPAAVPSARARAPQVMWTSNASASASVPRFFPTSSSDSALPGPLPSPFTAAVSSAVPYAPVPFTLRMPGTAAQHPFTYLAFNTPRTSVPTEPLPTPSPSSFSAAFPSAAAVAQEALALRGPAAAAQPAVSSDPHFAPWVSPSSLSIWAPLAASHWSPAVSAPTQGGIDSSPLPSSALRGPPSLSSDGAAGASPPQRGVEEGAPPATGRVVSASSVSPWHLPPSQPLSPSPWLPMEYRSASGTAGQEGSPEVDTWPFTSRVWGPLGTAPPVIGAGAFPTEGPEEPSHPEATSGDTQLAERLERAPDKQPGEAAPSWHPPGSSDSGS